MLLAPLYKKTTTIQPDELENVRQQWLWKTDCVMVGHDACGDMSPMHGAGLLFACLLARRCSSTTSSMAEWLPQLPLLHLSTASLSALTLRDLLDQLQCLQLHWGQVVFFLSTKLVKPFFVKAFFFVKANQDMWV